MEDSTASNDKQELIESVDRVFESPGSRAGRVYQVLSKENFTNWDIICFCAEYLGSQSLAYEWMINPIKYLVQKLYSYHYYNWKEIKKMGEDNGLQRQQEEHLPS